MNKSIIILAISLLSAEVAWKVLNVIIARHKSSKALEEKDNRIKKHSSIAEALIFTKDNQLCRDHAKARIPCNKENCPVAQVRRIGFYLNKATLALDLCMYIMTCDDLTMAIIGAHRRGVNVRIILDAGMSENSACRDQVTRMRHAGIKIRMNPLEPSSLMHHKFVIIDKEIILLGSTNWTMQAFYGNYDSIMITNEENCVKPYLTMFENMWLEFQT